MYLNQKDWEMSHFLLFCDNISKFRQIIFIYRCYHTIMEPTLKIRDFRDKKKSWSFRVFTL